MLSTTLFFVHTKTFSYSNLILVVGLYSYDDDSKLPFDGIDGIFDGIEKHLNKKKHLITLYF